MNYDLFLGMVHHILIDSNCSYREGFIKALSLATCHPQGPLFNEIELLGIKDGFVRRKMEITLPKVMRLGICYNVWYQK